MSTTLLLFHIIIIPVVFALGRLSARISFLSVRKRRTSNHIELMARGRNKRRYRNIS